MIYPIRMVGFSMNPDRFISIEMKDGLRPLEN